MTVYLLALSAFFATACNNAAILSPTAFTKVYKDSLSAAFPGNTFLIKADLEITAKRNDNGYSMFLDNAYNEYKRQPEAINSIIHRYIASAGDLLKRAEGGVQRNKIIPVIKDAGYIEDIRATMAKNVSGAKGPEMVYTVYNDKLIILYAQDNENSIEYLNEDNFKKSGIPKDSLLPIGLRNLDAALPEIQRNGANGLYMITAGGNYEASLILMKSLWDDTLLQVDGKFVIALPNRDMLLVTGSNNKEGIQKLKQMAAQMYKTGSYHLTPDLFTWTGSRFEPYQ
jgi:uncharacterized protein YtpQ (UPF0354 family)